MAILKVSDVKGWHKGVEQIGDTLFVDGTPYISCTICGIPLRKVDAFNGTKHTIATRDKKEVVIETYKVLIGHWMPATFEDEWNKELKMYVPVRHSKPMLRSVPACFDCWNNQQEQKRRNGDRLTFYDDRQLEKPKQKALIKPKESYNFVIKTAVEVSSAPKSNNTQAALMNELVRDYLEGKEPLILTMPIDKVVSAFETVGHIANNLLGFSYVGKPRLRLVV